MTNTRKIISKKLGVNNFKSETDNLSLSAKNIFIVFLLSGLLLVLIFIYLIINNKSNIANVKSNNESLSNVVSFDNNKQYIDIVAKNGFQPNYVVAKSNIDTIIRVTTSNTIDCSNIFNIPKLGVYKQLPINGKVEINIPPQNANTELIGSCGMGHYFLKIKFI